VTNTPNISRVVFSNTGFIGVVSVASWFPDVPCPLESLGLGGNDITVIDSGLSGCLLLTSIDVSGNNNLNCTETVGAFPSGAWPNGLVPNVRGNSLCLFDGVDCSIPPADLTAAAIAWSSGATQGEQRPHIHVTANQNMANSLSWILFNFTVLPRIQLGAAGGNVMSSSRLNATCPNLALHYDLGVYPPMWNYSTAVNNSAAERISSIAGLSFSPDKIDITGRPLWNASLSNGSSSVNYTIDVYVLDMGTSPNVRHSIGSMDLSVAVVLETATSSDIVAYVGMETAIPPSTKCAGGRGTR